MCTLAPDLAFACLLVDAPRRPAKQLLINHTFELGRLHTSHGAFEFVQTGVANVYTYVSCSHFERFLRDFYHEKFTSVVKAFEPSGGKVIHRDMRNVRGLPVAIVGSFLESFHCRICRFFGSRNLQEEMCTSTMTRK